MTDKQPRQQCAVNGMKRNELNEFAEFCVGFSSLISLRDPVGVPVSPVIKRDANEAKLTRLLQDLFFSF